ncbi:hypothetical protein FACS189456_6360 [Bacteroidia bacterium]|nr:hypothetical protein FACS189456_6360 [Bacteroidia bacterium]
MGTHKFLTIVAVAAIAGVIVTDCKKNTPAPSALADSIVSGDSTNNPVNTIKFGNFTETGDGLNFDMIAVKGGTFIMGSDNTIDNRASPPHSVTLSNFHIGKYEVTQKLWRDVMGSYPDTSASMQPSTAPGLGDNYPIYYISWNDIVGTPSGGNVGYTERGIDYYTDGFCYQLSVKANGGTLGTKHYRLPTEAEWEYATRGGAQSKGYTYSGSDSIDDVAWYHDNADGIIHPVGTKAANELGIYDMSGNVWEWCSDWWRANYSSSAQTNPTGASSGDTRAVRGGSLGLGTRYCRVAHRYQYAPHERYRYLGFRLVIP